MWEGPKVAWECGRAVWDDSDSKGQAQGQERGDHSLAHLGQEGK